MYTQAQFSRFVAKLQRNGVEVHDTEVSECGRLMLAHTDDGCAYSDEYFTTVVVTGEQAQGEVICGVAEEEHISAEYEYNTTTGEVTLHFEYEDDRIYASWDDAAYALLNW